MEMFGKMVCVDRTGIEDFAGERLKKMCGELVCYPTDPATAAEVCARIGDADAVLVSWRTKITADVMRACPNIRYVGMCCSLYSEASANVDIAYAKAHGITVKGCRHYGDEGVVLFVLGALSALCTGTYGTLLYDEPVELEGLKIGLIGMGAVGRKVAAGLAYFGAEIYYTAHSPVADVPYTFLALDELLDVCKIISIHVPRNTVVLSEREFSMMQGRVLINTGLGYAFDKDAFDRWIIREGNFAVFDTDSITPAFREQYRGARNIITNAYVSGFTKNARKRLADKVTANLEDYFRGE